LGAIEKDAAVRSGRNGRSLGVDIDVTDEGRDGRLIANISSLFSLVEVPDRRSPTVVVTYR
jgi:hypothetical protein